MYNSADSVEKYDGTEKEVIVSNEKAEEQIEKRDYQLQGEDE